RERDEAREERDKIKDELSRLEDETGKERDRMKNEITQLNASLASARGVPSPLTSMAARSAQLRRQELLGSPLKRHINEVMSSSALKDNNGRAGFRG
ncbi:hypothetical protein TrRE_jg782, partial [Triparma retinervis]